MIKFPSILFILFFLSGCNSEINYLPGEILDLKLNKKLQGEGAKDFVNKLHFNSVTDEENKIGFYKDEKNEAIIYITFYQNEKLADDYYNKMINKISPENSVFINPEIVEVADRKIYRCFGMGQSHYVFTSGSNLLWVSVDSHLGKMFISEYLTSIE